jgi:DNA-binding GntR family transcriptional regulator
LHGARSFPYISAAEIDAIEQIDDRIDQTMKSGDTEGYMRGNFQFHFAIYERANAPMLLALVESIWLQFGPFMRMAYGRIGTSVLEDHHEYAIAAMRERHVANLKAAIDADIAQGMAFIGDAVLSGKD